MGSERRGPFHPTVRLGKVLEKESKTLSPSSLLVVRTFSKDYSYTLSRDNVRKTTNF